MDDDELETEELEELDTLGDDEELELSSSRMAYNETSSLGVPKINEVQRRRGTFFDELGILYQIHR